MGGDLVSVEIRTTFIHVDNDGTKHKLTSLQASRTGFSNVRKFKRALKRGLEQMGLFFHDEILPKHFTVRGAKEYGYQRRQWTTRGRRFSKSQGRSIRTGERPGYEQRKIRFKGHRRPLVWSGEAERMILNHAKVTGTASKVSVVVKVPPYMLYKRGGVRLSASDRQRRRSALSAGRTPEPGAKSQQPDKMAELHAMSRADWEAMAEFLNRALQDQVDGRGATKSIIGPGHRGRTGAA